MSENAQPQVEQFEFQAEIKQLMHILAHSLYKNREVFIRELISNSADALEKVRFHLLTHEDEVASKDLELEINIDLDSDKNQLVISDTGIGMTKQELIDNIGQIAHSGSQDFIKKLSGDAQKDVNLIGQFGVGFYSVFMAADKVDVISKSYIKDEPAYIWTSKGEGEYTIQSIGGAERGTKIIIHLREDAREFTETYQIENVIRKYSNFIPFPIKINGEQANKTKAIWAEPKSNLKDEDYTEFYKFLSNFSEDPLMHLHLSIDMPIQFHALLYIPTRNTELQGFGKMDHRVNLYARRVLIQQNSEDILPDYLRFITGIVDCDDLPLNVSRETLQKNREVRHMSKALVGKVLGHLAHVAETDTEQYLKFWKEFGRIFKEGYTDFNNHDKFKPLLRFNSSSVKADELISLDGYLERMVAEQKEIYYLSGPNRATVEKSPHLEIFRKKGIEVIFLLDPLDEFILSSLQNYKEKPFKSVDQANLEAISEIPDKETEAEEEKPPLDDNDLQKLVDHIKVTLGDKRVSDVRISKRLTDSPAVLVNPDDAMSSHMQKVMRLMQQDVAVGPRIMEINPAHALVRNLVKIYEKNPRHPFVDQTCFQLYDNALYLEGFPPDPNEMVSRLQTMMADISSIYAEQETKAEKAE